MTSYRLSIGIVLTLLCSSEILAQDKPLDEQIKTLASEYVDAGIVNSVAIGVIDGEAEYFVGVGQLSRTDTRTPDENTVYELGSISKVFTGILLADAIERKLVTATTPAGELLPSGYSMPVSSKKPERKITLTDLSTHVSGLPRMPTNIDIAKNPTNPYVEYTAEKMFDFVSAHELTRKPGILEEYSNLGVGLLGELLSQKQNSDYESLLLDRITKPLAMNDTSLTLSADQRDRLATPHAAGLIPSSNWEFKAMAGAGAIRSTVGDMLKFCRANLSAPDSPTGKAIDIAFSQQRKPKGLGSRPMGFGWIINPGTETHWHNGGTGGYHTIMFVNRKQNRAAVVLCNTATGEVDRLGIDIMSLLAEKKVEPRNFRKSISVTPEICKRYVGTYKLNGAFTFTVAYANEQKTALTVQLTGQNPLMIYPETETLWFLKVVKAEIEFTVDDEGKCTALTLIQNGLRQKARKE